MKKRILTGDRPTGNLHLGHYVGTLKNRVELQDKYEVFILIADLHSLTTKPEKEAIKKIKENTREMMLDYLAVGLNPDKVTFFVQSQVPEIAHLSLLLSMVIGRSDVERIPTLKEVVRDNKIKNPSFGLMFYPVLQAADIISVGANLVPVGKDQESHIEIAKKIARNFNRLYGQTLTVPEAIIGGDKSLLGTDGKAKMSKSLGNAIYLSSSENEVEKKVKKMYTDPTRVHGNEPGKVEGNPVFIYLDAFHPDKAMVRGLKERYKKGSVGDVEVKEILAKAINDFLGPIRDRREKLEKEPEKIEKILAEGTKKARSEAAKVLDRAKEAMGFSS